MRTGLWKVCRQKSLPQKALARAVGIHPGRICQLANGKEPTQVEVAKLSEYFNCDEAELFAPIWGYHH